MARYTAEVGSKVVVIADVDGVRLLPAQGRGHGALPHLTVAEASELATKLAAAVAAQ